MQSMTIHGCKACTWTTDFILLLLLPGLDFCSERLDLQLIPRLHVPAPRATRSGLKLKAIVDAAFLNQMKGQTPGRQLEEHQTLCHLPLMRRNGLLLHSCTKCEARRTIDQADMTMLAWTRGGLVI